MLARRHFAMVFLDQVWSKRLNQNEWVSTARGLRAPVAKEIEDCPDHFSSLWFLF
jgi:hypothetical protein